MSCYVRGCKNIRRLSCDPIISFHRFPQKPQQRKAWLEAINRTEEEFAKAKQRIICSEHFYTNDFKEKVARRILKDGVVPHLKIKNSKELETSFNYKKQNEESEFNEASPSYKKENEESEFNEASPSYKKENEESEINETSFNLLIKRELETSPNPNRENEESEINETSFNLLIKRELETNPNPNRENEEYEINETSFNLLIKRELETSPNPNREYEELHSEISLNTTIKSEIETDPIFNSENDELDSETSLNTIIKSEIEIDPSFNGKNEKLEISENNLNFIIKEETSVTNPDSSVYDPIIVCLPLKEEYDINVANSNDLSFQEKQRSDTLDQRYMKTSYIKKNKIRSLTKRKYQRSRFETKCKKISSLDTAINILGTKNLLSTNAIEHLKQIIEDIPNGATRRDFSSKKYQMQFKAFAVTLHLYSSKAYKWLRKLFGYRLPHPSKIRLSSVDFRPGFLQPAFDVLSKKIQEAKVLKNQTLIFNLFIDEIPIQKNTEFYKKQLWGHVNMGTDLENDGIQLATQALVLMVMCLYASWKLPIAYFFIEHLSGIEKANIINEALMRLSHIGAIVVGVTCEGTSEHFSMFKHLGCNFKQANSLVTSFKLNRQNASSKSVYAVFDVGHLVNLICDSLATQGAFLAPDGNTIKWEYIENLHKIQEEEYINFTVGNDWKKQITDEYIKTQALSRDVAVAMESLRSNLKHPHFEKSKATITFIKIISGVVDILTRQKNLITVINENECRSFLEDAAIYLLSLKDIKGIFLWKTRRKNSILGLITTIKSIIGIYNDYVKINTMSYLLLHKFSQYHIQQLFHMIRKHNHKKNDPSCLEFMKSLRYILVQYDITKGTCKVLDATYLMSVNKNFRQIKETPSNSRNFEESRPITYVAELHDHNYAIRLHFIDVKLS